MSGEEEYGIVPHADERLNSEFQAFGEALHFLARWSRFGGRIVSSSGALAIHIVLST